MIVLLLIFVLFLVSALEDHIFKDWKLNNLRYFRLFKELEYLSHIKFSVNERLLIDVSVMLDVSSPFESGIVGSARRYIYLRLVPEIMKNISLIRDKDPGLWIARIGRRGRFKYLPQNNYPGIFRLNRHKYSRIHKFMLVNNIKYYIYNFSEWKRTKEMWERNGFKLIYNNQHFMLYEITENKNQ